MGEESIYDRALSEVGENGLFQKKFDFTYNFCLGVFWSMAYMNIILVLVVIPHHCKLPERTENISEHSWKHKFIPVIRYFQRIFHNWMQCSHCVYGILLKGPLYILFVLYFYWILNTVIDVKQSSCEIYVKPGESNLTKGCSDYEYDRTWYKSTVPSDNNWVCDSELHVANIYAYSRIGEIIGSVLFGWFGDTYGRKLTYVISLLLIIVGRCISIIGSKSFLVFVIGCIIAYFPSWCVMQSATVISLEISSPQRRTTTATIRIISWSLGVGVMPLLYWWLKNWRPFMIATTVTLVPFLIFAWKMIESPRWLWVTGKPKLCVKQLKRIGAVNKGLIKPETENELMTTKPLNDMKGLGPLALFSSWKLALNTTLQLILWVVASLSYTVLLMTTSEKAEGNPFLEFTWQTVAEIPGNLIGKWLSDHVGRRYAGVSAFLVTGSVWTLISVREYMVNSWLHVWWIGSSLITINRLSTTVSYYVINMLNMELYPTCLRQSGMSLGNVVSSVASAIAPYVIYLGRRNPVIPGIVLAGAGVVGIVSSLLLPETLNAKLPETLEDAQNFGKTVKKYNIIPLTVIAANRKDSFVLNTKEHALK